MHASAAAVNSLVQRAISFGAASLFAFMAFAGAAFADPPRHESRNAKQQSEEQLVFVTGSLIPQRVKLEPIATKTTSPIRIIDRREIDGTGRFTTPGALVNEPSARIVGH